MQVKTLKELRKEFDALKCKEDFNKELLSCKHCMVKIERVTKNGTLLTGFELHHIIALKDGGNNKPNNLIWIPTAIHRLLKDKEYVYNTRKKVLEFCNEYITNETQMTINEFKKYIEMNMFNEKEYQKEYDKKYYEINKDKIKEQTKQYKEANKEYYKKYGKRYKKANRRKLEEYSKQYRVNNKEKKKLYDQEYREKNKEKNKENRKGYYGEYCKTKNGRIANKKKICRRTIKNTKVMQTRIKKIVELNKLNQNWI